MRAQRREDDGGRGRDGQTMGAETGASMGTTGEHNGWPSEKGGRPGNAGTVAAAFAVALAAALA